MTTHWDAAYAIFSNGWTYSPVAAANKQQLADPMQALPAPASATILCTVSQDAHGFSDETDLGVDAYAEAAAAWRLGLDRAGGAPLRHLLVKYFALHLQPLGGPGFVLHMGGAVRGAVRGDLACAVRASRWPAVRPLPHGCRPQAQYSSFVGCIFQMNCSTY
jgi:hypothetical protein